MNIKLLLLLFCLASPLTYAQAATKSHAEEAISSALVLWDKTKVSGHEWITIKPLITQAKQALKANDFLIAITLAKRASEHSELALVQAEHEKNNWINNLPR